MTFAKKTTINIAAYFGFLVFASSLFASESAPHEENDVIGKLEKNGVEVQINQVQIQRISGDVQIEGSLMSRIVEPPKYRRMIAMSLSQRGQGKASGPISVTLKNGDKLQMRISTNQRLMSLLANARIPEGMDHNEYWFEVPNDTPFEELFPLTVEYKTTNTNGKKCEFKFERIFP